MGDFNGKVVVVTGGNSGIGEAVARGFDKSGAKVVLFGRNADRLERVRSHLKEAISVQGDVKNIADLDRLYEVAVKAFGGVDVLVANAGIAGGKHVGDVDESFFDNMVDTNFKGIYFTVQKAVPHLNDNASVVLISSAAAHSVFPKQSVYASTKAAVSMLARSFSADLIGRGIRVNAVSPGFTDTPIFDDSKATNPDKLEAYTQRVPVKRFASPSEIADAVLYLSSPKAAYVVGVDLVIDGGVSRLSL